MDPITQGALGGACAQAVLHNKDKRNAWLVGALAGMAADLDIFIRSSQDPLLFFIYHRHFTHSLFFIPIGGLVVALFLFLFKRFRKHWKITYAASLIGYATHGILDAFTSYGTLLYWPLSNDRIAWDIIAIIDPFFTAPLILGIVWTLVFDNRRGVFIGLGLAGLFLLFNSWQHHRAIATLNEYATQKSWQISKLRAFPHLLSSRYWRVAFFNEKKLFVGDVFTPLTAKSVLSPLKEFSALQVEEIPAHVKTTGKQWRDYTVFNWFADGYLINICNNPYIVVDARFIFKDKPMTALWGLQFVPNQDHAKLVRSLNLDDTHAYCNSGNWQ